LGNLIPIPIKSIFQTDVRSMWMMEYLLIQEITIQLIWHIIRYGSMLAFLFFCFCLHCYAVGTLSMEENSLLSSTGAGLLRAGLAKCI